MVARQKLDLDGVLDDHLPFRIAKRCGDQRAFGLGANIQRLRREPERARFDHQRLGRLQMRNPRDMIGQLACGKREGQTKVPMFPIRIPDDPNHVDEWQPPLPNGVVDPIERVDLDSNAWFVSLILSCHAGLSLDLRPAFGSYRPHGLLRIMRHADRAIYSKALRNASSRSPHTSARLAASALIGCRT